MWASLVRLAFIGLLVSRVYLARERGSCLPATHLHDTSFTLEVLFCKTFGILASVVSRFYLSLSENFRISTQSRERPPDPSDYRLSICEGLTVRLKALTLPMRHVTTVEAQSPRCQLTTLYISFSVTFYIAQHSCSISVCR